MENPAELITALRRAVAQLRAKKSTADEVSGSEIVHNLQCANLIINHYERHNGLEAVQISLAEKVIERANRKEKVQI